jgi:hypothetical protein
VKDIASAITQIDGEINAAKIVVESADVKLVDAIRTARTEAERRREIAGGLTESSAENAVCPYAKKSVLRD